MDHLHKRLQAISGGIQPLEQELVELFCQETRIHLSQMRSALAYRDFKGLAFHGHALRGASLTIGAEEFAELCNTFEFAAIQDTSLLNAALESLEYSFQQLERCLLSLGNNNT